MRHIKGSLERTWLFLDAPTGSFESLLFSPRKNLPGRLRPSRMETEDVWLREAADVGQEGSRCTNPEEKSRAGGRRRGSGLAPGGQPKPLKSQESCYYREFSSYDGNGAHPCSPSPPARGRKGVLRVGCKGGGSGSWGVLSFSRAGESSETLQAAPSRWGRLAGVPAGKIPKTPTSDESRCRKAKGVCK